MPGRPVLDAGLAIVPYRAADKTAIAVFDLHDGGRVLADQPVQLPDDDAVLSVHPTADHIIAWSIDRLYALRRAQAE